MFFRKILFFLLIIACLTPYVSPPAALALGLALAFTVGNPFQGKIGKPTRILLQVSIVLLGFGMDLSKVVAAGRSGILFTIATIFGTLALGWFIGKILKVKDKTSSLISSGTAICGGSAIAAIAPAIRADSEEISVSLATIFILNSVALFIFPAIGHWLNLTPNQFGVWAAIAIHDTSSVVGAAAKFGGEALQTATALKLARALWIVPVTLFFAFVYRSNGSEKRTKIAVPWFIFLFLLATVLRTYAPTKMPPSIFDSLVNVAKTGLTITLFLIGASLSRSALKTVGVRPLIQGILLWIVISIVALFAVLQIL